MPLNLGIINNNVDNTKNTKTLLQTIYDLNNASIELNDLLTGYTNATAILKLKRSGRLSNQMELLVGYENMQIVLSMEAIDGVSFFNKIKIACVKLLIRFFDFCERVIGAIIRRVEEFKSKHEKTAIWKVKVSNSLANAPQEIRDTKIWLFEYSKINKIILEPLQAVMVGLQTVDEVNDINRKRELLKKLADETSLRINNSYTEDALTVTTNEGDILGGHTILLRDLHETYGSMATKLCTVNLLQDDSKDYIKWAREIIANSDSLQNKNMGTNPSFKIDINRISIELAKVVNGGTELIRTIVAHTTQATIVLEKARALAAVWTVVKKDTSNAS